MPKGSNAAALARLALSWSMRAPRSSAPVAEIDARADRAHRVLEVQVGAVAQRAALDVVLLRRHPGARAVRRNRDGAQIVRHAAALVLEVGLVAVRAARWCSSPSCVAADTTRPRRRRRAGCTCAVCFARQRRRDEARDVHDGAVRVHRDVPRVRADVEACRACARSTASSLSNAPVASSTTNAIPPVGANTRPYGCERVRQRDGLRRR